MNRKKILKNTGDFQEFHLNELKNPRDARLYLEVAFDEYQKDNDIPALLLALKDVAKAQGSIPKFSRILDERIASVA